MIQLLIYLLLAQAATPRPEDDVMLAAVSRDSSMLEGGLGGSSFTGRGSVVVEPMVLLTKTGAWKDVPCPPGGGPGCRKFAREYLSKPHQYTVIGGDGASAAIRSKPTTLSECYDYSGPGAYTGAAIAKWTIAASVTEPFTESPPLKPVEAAEAARIRKALGVFIPKRLSSTDNLRLFSVRLEGHDLLVIQRAFRDAPISIGRMNFVFAIGRWDQTLFRVLRWEHADDPDTDEEERVLGTIGLKSGRDCLVTVMHHPEGHAYRIYGIKDGKLTLVYSGGGSSC